MQRRDRWLEGSILGFATQPPAAGSRALFSFSMGGASSESMLKK